MYMHEYIGLKYNEYSQECVRIVLFIVQDRIWLYLRKKH